MNTPPEVISMGSPGEYHDPGPNFDLSGQQQAWKDESEPGLQPNGGYDKLEVKEEDEEGEELLEEKGMEEEYERRNEEEEEFSSASSRLSEEEADGDDEDEGHHLDREISAREQVTSGGVHSPKGESEHHGSPREHIHDDASRREEEEEEEDEEDVGIHEESHTTRNDDDDDHEDSHREMNQGDDEEEDEEDEGEDDDDNDEEDRIKETQKLVAKIEHDIQGLRFQAKQRGHLLSDLHRYGAQNQQRRKEQERLKESPVEQTNDLRMAALPQKPADEGKIIERPVSIKLRLRTRSSSPKAQQERYAMSPVVKAKPGKVKMRVLRIGKQLGRWDAWKESLAVKADRDLAKIMMDHMDRTYFQQFLPPPKADNKGHKRKKRESRKHERKAKKPKQVKVVEEPEEWADGFLDEDDMDDYYDPVEEKNDYDYDPTCESTKFGAYKPSNPVRNKRKSQRPRKLLGVNSSPRASRTTKPTRQPRRSPKAPKDEEQENVELPVVQKKRGRKPKPKPEVIQTEKKKTPRIHRGGRRPSLMSTLRNLDWNALPRRYECKICCLRFDGIVAFRSHLETTHASEYLKSKEPNNHKPSGEEENSNDAQEAEKHFHGSEKPYQESEKQYEDLGHLPDQHSSMQDAEQRRMAESEMYRTMAYGQEMIDARRFEMMPPFKRHLHESFSNEWGKMQGNMYSRPLASGQMIHGEQSWGHNRGYDTIPAYRKHYEDGRDWSKGGGQYPHVITSLGQSMHMGIDGGGGGHREEQHGEGYNMQGGNMLGMEHAPSEESTYVDMSMRHSEENPNQDPEDMSRDRMEGEEQERNEQTQEGEPPPPNDPRSDESDREAEEEINEQKDDEEEKGDENNTGKKGKRKKTKPYKEWEEIDRWAVTFVHCPQCDDYIRFRPGQKNFHFAVHAERRLCQECGKMFTKEAFRAHVRVHQAKRLGEVLKHICEVCGKGYRFKCSLSSHMRCHTGVRDFDCKICGKKFLSAHGLEKHELVHRKVKPHMCPDCGRGFTQYHNMLAHRRQHTGEKPYRCNICDRSFTHNVSLKNHKKKEHGVDLWAGTGGKPPSSNRQRSKSTRSAPVVVSVSPPVPQQPPAPPKPSVPNERELMHTLDPSQLYSMMPTLDYGHY